MDQEDVSQLRHAAKRNVNEDLFGGKGSDAEDDDAVFAEDPKGVQLFDFDAYGRKTGKQKYEATFGSSSESSSTESSSSSGSTTSTSSSGGESSGTFEFDDEDFAEIDRLRRDRRTKKDNPMDRRRMWESSFFINSFMNLETKEQYFFYSVTFGHVNKKRNIRGSLRRRFLFTPGYRLNPGEYRPLAAPLVIWPLKVFLLPYNQLHNFCVTVELWKISDFSFNSLYASARLTLKEIIDLEPEFQLLLKRKLPGSKRSYEVHKMRVSFQLNEVFDVDMVFDSWWFLPDKKMPPKLQRHQKALSLNVPTQGRSQRRSNSRTDISKNNYWSYAGFFSFRGTLPSLSNQYIVVTVACMFEHQWYRPPLQLGVCIMSLKSVTTYPLFRGVVKKLTTNPKKFQQGEIIGNIRCFIRSVGILGYEDIAYRPSQSIAGTALVTQLNLKEQYLVVRVFKCENLPVANADSFSSNPMVKVKWDGMVNSGARRENTLRPVFNQSFYFPVRLLDPRERTSPLFRKFTLPLDLFAKGPLSLEVWDSDDTTSDFLGGTDISLHLLWKEGQRDTRSLAVGIEESDEKTRLPDGRPAEFANRDASDYSRFENTLLGDEDRVVVPPYEWPYETLVLKRVLELKGSTLPQPTGERSLLWCEVFFIPPMPEDVEMPPQPTVKNANDVWMQVERRWNKDFRRWQKMYLQWFPEAPKERRFFSVAEHSQSRLIFPLPSFVVPIAVPAQLAVEGELLHWLSNIAYLFSPKQLRDGEFQRWQSPASLLTTRRGGVNDHAILLCSCLLGLDYDAYVCKGTVDGCDSDHAWVMTRHAGGWIVFWEVTNRRRLCLPYRWGYPSKGPPETFVPKDSLDQEAEKYWEGTYLEEWFAWIEYQAAAATDAARMAAEGATIPDSELWGEDVAPDETLDPEAVVAEEGGILNESKGRAKTKSVAQKVDKSELRKIMQDQLDKLPITPVKDLLKPDSTLSYVPYSSIEVVFNNFQLWGNLQNLHPACITYDFDDVWKWRPLLTEPADPIETDIIIATPIRDKKCQLLAEDLVGNVTEHIRMQRLKNGNDVSFEHREDMLSKLTFYLDLLEFRLHLDEAHNPGPPPRHLGWSSFPEEMADASASAKADYDFFDAVQASNVPTFGEGEAPDPLVQGALQMMGEGRNDFQGLFSTEPPPGGLYDPYAMTGTGTYVAPDDAARLGGQQGGYLHLETSAAPSRPPVYQVPMNPVDAAAAALVDYEAENRRAQKEEANLVKGYMAGGNNTAWPLVGRGSKGDNVAPSGLHFTQAPQYAAGLPSRACSSISLNINHQRTTETEQGGDAHLTARTDVRQARKNERRSKLKSLQCILQQASAEGFRLLQGMKKQQRTGKASAESRSFFAGTTAAAAAAANSKHCNEHNTVTPEQKEPNSFGVPTAAFKGCPVEGGALVGDAAGPDTSTVLLHKLAKGSQLLAKELDAHLKRLRCDSLTSYKGLLAARKKRRALRPWRRAAAAMRKKQQHHAQKETDQRNIVSLNSKVLGLAHAGNSSSGVGAVSEEADQRTRAQLLLKEELRRRVYEQMEARAAQRQEQQNSGCAEGTSDSQNGSRQQGLLRVFKAGFDSDPPSSHGSYETASEFASSESAPTEAYVSPTSSCGSTSRNSSHSSTSSRGSHISRASSVDSRSAEPPLDVPAVRRPTAFARAATCCRTTYSRCSSGAASHVGAAEAAAETSEPATPPHAAPGRQDPDDLRKRRGKRPDFKWVAGYPKQGEGGFAAAAGKQRQRHVAVSVASEGGTLRQQLESYERQKDQQQAAANHQPFAASSSQTLHQSHMEGGSVASIDLEARRSHSFISEKGTLDSLPDSDCCESAAACHSPGEYPLLVSPPLKILKRRIRRRTNLNDSRTSSSCESVTAFLESITKEDMPIAANHVKKHPTPPAGQRGIQTAPAETALGQRGIGAAPAETACLPDTLKDTEEWGESPSPMATRAAGGGVSARMQQLYAACRQRARSSFFSGRRTHPSDILQLKKTNAATKPAAAVAVAAERSHIEASVAPSATRRYPSSNCSSVTRASPMADGLSVSEIASPSEPATSAAAASVVATAPSARYSSGTRAVGGDGPEPQSSGTGDDGRDVKGLKFVEIKEHGMMLDIDYDQVNRNLGGNNATTSGPPPAPPGMVYNRTTGVNEYAYAVTTTGGVPYGNMALGAIQQAGPVAPVALNQGRLADVRREGAYRIDPVTGEKNYVEGGGADRARQYGAMDFISSAVDTRPKIGTDGLPEGFDMKYARQKYEAGVVTGAEALVRGGERQAEAEQLEREAQAQLDPYGDLLEPPKEPLKEYTAFDGGVDLSRMGFTSGVQVRKAIRKKDGAEAYGQQEGAEEILPGVAEEPRVPTEWKMPVSSGTYAAEQRAKWNWYYRMEQVYYLWQKNVFPVKPNHVFCGFPIHLATADSTEIRSYLGGGRRFRRLLDMPVENINYVVTGKCYPLMGGVISTWLFFGAQVPLGTKQERKSHMRRIKRPPHTKPRVRANPEGVEGSQNPPGDSADDGAQPAAADEQQPLAA